MWCGSYTAALAILKQIIADFSSPNEPPALSASFQHAVFLASMALLRTAQYAESVRFIEWAQAQQQAGSGLTGPFTLSKSDMALLVGRVHEIGDGKIPKVIIPISR